MSEDAIKSQERRVEEAVEHYLKLVKEACLAQNVWERLRKDSQRACEACLIQKLKLNEMKGLSNEQT